MREAPGVAVGAEGDLVEQPHRDRAAAAGLEVDVDDLGLHVARNRRHRGDQRRALARHDVVEPEAAGADLREIMVEPVGQGGVEIDDVAVAFRREEPGRSMIEIIDRVLELLKYVLVPLELARHVGERPDRDAGLALAVAERAHADAQPAAGLALVGTDAHFLLAATPLARSLEQAIDRFGNAGIADEGPLDRRHVGPGGLDQREVSAIAIDDAAAGIGDQQALTGVVDDRLEQGARRLSTGNAQDPGGERKQEKSAGHGENRQQRQDVRLGIGAADEQEGCAGTDEDQCDQQHQSDAAGATARAAAVDRGTGVIVDQLLLRHDGAESVSFASSLSAPAARFSQVARALAPKGACRPAPERAPRRGRILPGSWLMAG